MAADLHHVALFVKDLDRALRVFQDLLGFRLAWRAPRVGGAKLSAVLGMPNMQAEIAYLVRNPAGVAVELVRLLDESEESISVPSSPRNGAVLSLTAPDLERLHSQLTEGGWKPFTPIVRMPAPDGNKVNMFCFRLEEGLTIELIRPDGASQSGSTV